MDEQLEKAIQTANYMATLSTQKKLALEEFKQSSIYYHNGASFLATKELITFVKTLIDLGNTDFVVIDDNSVPVEITSLQDFLESLIDIYTRAANAYITTYNDLKKKRRVEDLVSL